MKKILFIVALIVVLGAGAFYMFLRPAPAPLEAEDFIPSSDNGVKNFMVLELDDMGGLLERITDIVSYSAQTLIPVLGGAEDSPIEDLESVSEKIRSYSSEFGKTVLYFSVVPNGLMPETELYGICSVRNEEPSSFLDSFFSDLSSSTEGLMAIPYDAELGEKATALYQILDPGTGMTLSIALFEMEEPFLLLSHSTEGLRNMLAAAEDASVKPDLGRKLDERNSLYLSLDTALMKDVLEGEGLSLYSEDPMVMEVSFSRDEQGYLMKCHSNASDIFFSSEQLKAYEPVESLPVFPGGGRVTGFLHARTSGVEKERIRRMIDDPQAGELRLGLEYIDRLYGISVEDILDLLHGKLSIVLGGKATSLIGEIPGLFVILEPENRSIPDKFISILPLLNLPLSPNRMTVGEWDPVYGFASPVSITVASGEGKILAGILDPGTLGSTAVIPEELARYLKGESYGTFALSVKDLRTIVMDAYERTAPLLPGGGVQSGFERFSLLLEKVDAMIARGESLSDSFLRIIPAGSEQ
jgi:hypothetical protein